MSSHFIFDLLDYDFIRLIIGVLTLYQSSGGARKSTCKNLANFEYSL